MGQYKCCCCIPVRAGVMIIAFLSAAFYIALTVFLFLSYNSTEYANAGYVLQIAQGIHWTAVSVCIISALASLFGIVGSIAQHRGMIALFRVIYWIVVILQLITCIAAIIFLGVKRGEIIDACGSIAGNTADECSVGYRNLMIIICVVAVVVNFVQIYFATAISSYSKRLRRTNMHEKLRNLEDFPEPPNKTEFF